jgi:hypothetical protein
VSFLCQAASFGVLGMVMLPLLPVCMECAAESVLRAATRNILSCIVVQSLIHSTLLLLCSDAHILCPSMRHPVSCYSVATSWESSYVTRTQRPHVHAIESNSRLISVALSVRVRR